MNPFSLGSALFEFAERAASATVDTASYLARTISNEQKVTISLEELDHIHVTAMLRMEIADDVYAQLSSKKHELQLYSVSFDEANTLDGTILEGKDGTTIRFKEVNNLLSSKLNK